MFLAIKTDDGRIKGRISFYCRVLHVSRQAFHKYLKIKDAPWKYQSLAGAMLEIRKEDECNDTYGKNPNVPGIASQTARRSTDSRREDCLTCHGRNWT